MDSLSPEAWAAGAAAVFSFLSVIVARLNYADDEIHRQNRIENRIGGLSMTLEYERRPQPSPMSTQPIAPDLGDKEYRFRVADVLVVEEEGVRYLLSKILHGFGGRTEVTVSVRRWGVGNWLRENPPDIDLVEDFSGDGDGVILTLDPENSEVKLLFSHSNVDQVEERTRAFLDFVEENLAT